MPDLPCPCWRQGTRRIWGRGSAPGPTRTVLFLLSQPELQIAGAVVQGRVLPAAEAQQLWQAHAWQPASVGQPWPVDPAGMQEQRFPALETAAPEW